MTQKEKILLFKDLCARIPYGLKASVRGSDEEDVAFNILSVATNFRVFVESRFVCISHSEDIEVVRPYLRPMSSMTKEEVDGRNQIALFHSGNIASVPTYMDWLNEHYFDYRGLIEKGLAISAPEGIYN